MLNLLAKWITGKLLEKIKFGKLVLIDGDKTVEYGESSSQELSCSITIHDSKFYRAVAFGGSVAAAKSYIEKEWDVDDLTKFIRLIIRNKHAFYTVDSGIAKISNWLLRIWHYFRANTINGSKRNIQHHYDLSNQFFALWLDPSMMYSCAYYTNGDSLEKASTNKLRLICEKLELTADDHILEIGAGWGGFAIYAHQNYGCKVTTTTISNKQYAYVEKKITQLNLQDDITLIKQDYRHLQGKFNKIVSIEMFEAIGHEYFKTYFKQIDELLVDGGLALIQTITIRNEDYERAKNEIDFIKRYIFPGGCLPSDRILKTLVNNTDHLTTVNMEEIGLHYVKTLQAWTKLFKAQEQKVMTLGYAQEFIRMWYYYLCYCEAGFSEKSIGNVQLLVRKNI